MKMDTHLSLVNTLRMFGLNVPVIIGVKDFHPYDDWSMMTSFSDVIMCARQRSIVGLLSQCGTIWIYHLYSECICACVY